jgi:hypothetical protein
MRFIGPGKTLNLAIGSQYVNYPKRCNSFKLLNSSVLNKMNRL